VDDQVLMRTAFRVIFDETDDIAVVGEAGPACSS
jgi:DNA-binding NarL/FixJ family response regulator